MGTSDGHVVGTTQIVDHGSPAVRWNVAIVAEGYTSGQLAQFHTDADAFSDWTRPYAQSAGIG